GVPATGRLLVKVRFRFAFLAVSLLALLVPALPHSATAATATSRWRWYLRNENSPGSADITPFDYGNPAMTDFPVTGDWNGDGTTSIGVVRVNSKTGHLVWLLRNTNVAGAPDTNFEFGSDALGDLPVVGDW